MHRTSVSLIGWTRSEGRRSRAWRRRQWPRWPRERSRQLRRVGEGREGRGGGAASIASMPPRRRGPCASTHALSRWSSPPFSSLTTLVSSLPSISQRRPASLFLRLSYTSREWKATGRREKERERETDEKWTCSLTRLSMGLSISRQHRHLAASSPWMEARSTSMVWWVPGGVTWWSAIRGGEKIRWGMEGSGQKELKRKRERHELVVATNGWSTDRIRGGEEEEEIKVLVIEWRSEFHFVNCYSARSRRPVTRWHHKWSLWSMMTHQQVRFQ